MQYHLVLTEQCNKQCTYCGGTRHIEGIPLTHTYDIDDLIARMVYSRNGDIHRDVSHLLNLEKPRFDHVHWQLDVFWSDLDSWNDLEGWLKRYEDGITRLVQDFGESFNDGKPLGLVPFLLVFKTFLTGEGTPHIRCGSGATSFTVMTNGQIDVCPIAPELSYSNVGDIRTSTPESLINIQPVGLLARPATY